MKEVKIKFTDNEKQKIKDGDMIAFASKKKYGQVGDYFEIDGYLFKFTEIEEKMLWDIATFFRRKFAIYTRADFREYWNRTHKQDFNSYNDAYLHLFEEIEESEIDN